MVYRRWLTVKKRKKRSGTTIIMVSIIIAINLAGINYAQWNEGMRVTSSIKTGTMDVQIVDFNVSIKDEESKVLNISKAPEVPKASEESKASEVSKASGVPKVAKVPEGLKGTKRLKGAKGGSDLNIVGTMEAGQTAIVTYSVKNRGTLPVKFGTPRVVEENNLNFDLTSALKDVDGKTGGTGQFEITALEEGNYSFAVELPYSLDVQ